MINSDDDLKLQSEIHVGKLMELFIDCWIIDSQAVFSCTRFVYTFIHCLNWMTLREKKVCISYCIYMQLDNKVYLILIFIFSLYTL